MHILYIHQYFGTNASGGGTRSFDYARYLARRGHRVTVLAGETHREREAEAGRGRRGLRRFEAEGVEVLVVPVPYSNRMGFAGRVGSFLAFAGLGAGLAATLPGVDVVYATSTPLTVGIPALAARFLRRVPYAFEVRDIWPEIPIALGILKNPILIAASRAAERAFYAHARRVVGISRGIVERLEAKGVPPEKLEVLYTGADGELFDRIPPDVGALRRLGLADKLVAVYPGAHSDVNGLGYVLDAAEHLRSEPRVAFLLVGDGRSKAGLVQQAKERGLENVVFLGRQPKEQVVGLLKACQVGVDIGEYHEVFGPAMTNKFYDFLFAGLPVVTNYPSEQDTWLSEKGAGLSADPADPGTLARILVDFADHPDERVEMGARARELGLAHFDRRELVGALERILQEVAR